MELGVSIVSDDRERLERGKGRQAGDTSLEC